MQSYRPHLLIRMDSLNTTLDSQQLVNQPIMTALPGTPQIRQKICHFIAEIGTKLNVRSRQELKFSFATIFFSLTEDEWASAQMFHVQKQAEEQLLVKQARLVEEKVKNESIDVSLSVTSIQDQASSFQGGSLEETPKGSRIQPPNAMPFVKEAANEAKGGNIEVTSLEHMNPTIFVKATEQTTKAPLKFNKVKCARRVSQRTIEMGRRQATLQRSEERFDSISFSPLKYGQKSTQSTNRGNIYALQP